MKNKQKQAHVAHKWNKSAKIYHQLWWKWLANKDASKEGFYHAAMMLALELNTRQ